MTIWLDMGPLTSRSLTGLTPSLPVNIPEYGSEAMEVVRVAWRVGSTIDVYTLAMDAKVNMRGLSYRNPSRCIDKEVGALRQSTVQRSGAPHTCRRTVHARWVDVTNTKQKSIAPENLTPRDHDRLTT
ncbi:hypothetical protein EDB87DRAFT_1825804 [Lactarius vividus]|nr:hypothetical protein EDB87DRAFT_1825804 [Lactarius vividus]